MSEFEIIKHGGGGDEISIIQYAYGAMETMAPALCDH